jgi:hypothetical protein
LLNEAAPRRSRRSLWGGASFLELQRHFFMFRSGRSDMLLTVRAHMKCVPHRQLIHI